MICLKCGPVIGSREYHSDFCYAVCSVCSKHRVYAKQYEAADLNGRPPVGRTNLESVGSRTSEALAPS